MHSVHRTQTAVREIFPLMHPYVDYDDALTQTGLQTLDERREELCRRFAQACTKNPKTQKMFPLNPNRIGFKGLRSKKFWGPIIATNNFAYEVKATLDLECTYLESRVAKIGLNGSRDK